MNGFAYLHDPLDRAIEEGKELDEMIPFLFLHTIPAILLASGGNLCVVEALVGVGV